MENLPKNMACQGGNNTMHVHELRVYYKMNGSFFRMDCSHIVAVQK